MRLKLCAYNDGFQINKQITMKFRQLILTSAFSTAVFSGTVVADTTLTYNNANGQENSKMYLSDGWAKVTNEGDVNTALIFNNQQNSFTVVNHQDQSYMVFGEKEIAALGDVSAMVDRMLEEQLAQMPAAQREQMRGMMKSMIQKQMPKQAALTTYEKTGQSASYNGFSCDEVIQSVDGKKQGDFCVADHQDLGVKTADYTAIQEFMKIAEKMASQFGQSQGANFAAVGDVLPVYYEIGQEKAYLTSISTDRLNMSIFMVPEGYKKQALPKEMFQ